MGDYGLIVKNIDQEIQIDSKYRNLSLDQEINNVTVSNGNTYDTYCTKISIDPSPLVPLVLIRPSTDNYVTVRSYIKSDGDFTGVGIVTKYDQSTTIDLQVYRENRIESDETYGLKIYNPSGELVFDSGKKYFKVRSVHTINLDAPSAPGDGDYVDISHPEISDPFYVLAPNSWCTWTQFKEPVGWLTEQFMIGIKKLSATSVRVGWFPFAHYISTHGYPQCGELNPTMTLLVCKP